MNISPHTRVRHLLEKKEEKKRRKTKRRERGRGLEAEWEEILRCMKSHPKFPSPCPESLMLHQLTLWSGPSQSKDSVQRLSSPVMWCCVSGRCASGSADSWWVCGENGQWWVVTVGAVTKCSSQSPPRWISLWPSSYQSWREENPPPLPPPPRLAYIRISQTQGGIHLQIGCLGEPAVKTRGVEKETMRGVKRGHRYQTSVSGIPHR